MILSVGNIILIIVTVILVVAFFAYLIGSYIYKKSHHIPTGECAGCSSKMRRAFDQAKKEIHSNKEHACSCQNHNEN